MWVGYKVHIGTRSIPDVFHLPSDCLGKFFLTFGSLGHYNKPKIKCEKKLEFLENLLRSKKKRKIPSMTWETWFSTNRFPNLTLLLLTYIYTFLMDF